MAKKYENLEFENCYPMEDIIAFHKLAVKQRDPKPQVSQGPNIQTLQIGNNIQNKITHHGNIIDLDITINIGNNNYVVSNSFEFFNSHTHPLESFLFPVSNQSKSQSSQKKKQPKFKQIQVQESSEAPSLRSSNSPLKKPTKRIRKPGKYYDYENYQYRYYSPKHSQTEENSLQENQNQKLKEKEKEKKNKKKSLFNTQKLSKINKQHRKYPPLQRINPNNFQQIEDYENNSTNTSQQESLNQTSQALQEEEYDEDEGTLLESQQQNLNSNQNLDEEEEEYEDITNQDTSQCLESASNLQQKPIKLVKKSQSFDPSYQEKNKKTKYYYNKQNISKNNLKKQQYQQYNQIIKPKQIHPYSETDDSSSVMSKSPLKKTTPIQYSQFYHKSLQNNFNNNKNHDKSEISSQSSLQKNSEISQFNFTSQKQNQSNQSNQLNNFQQNDQSETKQTNTIQDKKQYLQQTQQLNQNHYPYFNNLENTTNTNNNLNNKVNNNNINNINNNINNNHIEQEEQTTSEQITNNNNNNKYNNNNSYNNNYNNNSSQNEDNKTSQDFYEESQISSSCEPITSFKLNENKRVDVEELKQAGIFTNRKNAVKNIVKAFNRFLQLKENEQELLNIPQINRDVQVLRDIKKCVNRLERKKKYNQQLIYNIFQSDKLNYTFRHFLVQHAYNWLFESKIKDQDIYEKVIGDYIKWFNQL